MKYLDNYISFSEGVIKPLNFDKLLQSLKNEKFDGISSLNKMSREYKVEFADFDTFHDSLGTEIEKEMAPRELELFAGIKFALYNKYKDMIMIVVIEDKFIKSLSDKEMVRNICTFLNEVLRHESIHLQQVSRMGNSDLYLLDSSPTHNPKKYWNDKKELMAYAQSLIDQLVEQGKSKDDILQLLNNPKDIKSWVWDVYKKVLNAKQMKRFKKYLWGYWDAMGD